MATKEAVKYYGTGRRKSSVARVYITAGKGKIVVNGEDVNKYMYEAKFIGRVGPFRDKVRTFCQNPSGFVSAEVYDNNLTFIDISSFNTSQVTNMNFMFCN